MPADATWDDLMREIYVRESIEKGLMTALPEEQGMWQRLGENTDYLNESALDRDGRGSVTARAPRRHSGESPSSVSEQKR